MNADTLKGIAVVSLQEGATLGRVVQALFDLAARQLRGLEVRGDNGTFIVPFEQIKSIGSDAVMVASSQVTQTANASSATGTMIGMNELEKLKVVDNTGTFLGTLEAIEFDAANGRVTKLSVHKGGILGVGGTTTTLDASSNLVVGSELLTVDMNVDSTP